MSSAFVWLINQLSERALQKTLKASESFAEASRRIGRFSKPVVCCSTDDLLALVAKNTVPGEDAAPVEVLQIVDRVGDVICPIHQIRFRSLYVVLEEFPRKLEIFPLCLICSPLLAAALGAWIAKPGVLKTRSQGCSCKIEPLALVKTHSQLGQNAKRLRVPFVAFIPVFCNQHVKNMFTDMTKGRVT